MSEWLPPGQAATPTRRRWAYVLSLVFLLAGLAFLGGSIEVVVAELTSPPWWFWLYPAGGCFLVSWWLAWLLRPRDPKS